MLSEIFIGRALFKFGIEVLSMEIKKASLSLIAFSLLISGCFQSYTSVDLYCKDCDPTDTHICQKTCEGHFSRVGAPLISYTTKTQKLGEKDFVLCQCKGRLEDSKKILQNVTDSMTAFFKDSTIEGGKIKDNLKTKQSEEREEEGIQINDCNGLYDQPYSGWFSESKISEYEYAYCSLRYIVKNKPKTDGINLCEKRFVYVNTNLICRDMIAYFNNDISICTRQSQNSLIQISDSPSLQSRCKNILLGCDVTAGFADENCLKELALITGDYKKCYGIHPDNRNEWSDTSPLLACLTESATFTGDVNLCEEIKGGEEEYSKNYNANIIKKGYKLDLINMTRYSDTCYLFSSKVNNDEKICDKIRSIGIYNDCITTLAVTNKDIRLCDKIKGFENDKVQTADFRAQVCKNNFNKVLFKS
jgi:hypothetical protein